MASTTYEHFVNVNKMYAIHERFLDLMKTYHFADVVKMVTFCHRFAVIGSMVRNAGQLPQPFWLGAVCGGGSDSLSASVART